MSGFFRVEFRNKYGGRTSSLGDCGTCLPVLGFLSLMSIFFIYITIIYGTDGRKERGTRARVAENDVPFHRSARH